MARHSMANGCQMVTHSPGHNPRIHHIHHIPAIWPGHGYDWCVAPHSDGRSGERERGSTCYPRATCHASERWLGGGFNFKSVLRKSGHTDRAGRSIISWLFVTSEAVYTIVISLFRTQFVYPGHYCVMSLGELIICQ